MNILLAARKRNNVYFILVFSLYIFLIGSNISHALSEKDKQNPAILVSEGWKLLKKGDMQSLSKAEEFFQKAINLDGIRPADYADAYAGLGSITLTRGTKGTVFPYVKYDKDQCMKALEFIEKAISMDNKNGQAHYVKGYVLLCLGDYDGAIREAEMLEGQWSKCIPHLIKCRAYAGKIKIKKNASNQHMAIVEATDYLECAQSSNSSSGMYQAFSILRDLLLTTKDFDSTAQYFKRNIELKPYSMWSYHNYYWLLLLKTDAGYLDSTAVAEAEKTIKEAKAVVNYTIGALWEIRLKRGDKYFALKQYDKALVEYTEVLAERSHPFVVGERMPYICSQLTDGRCIKAWQKIIRAYLDRGDCRGALKEFNLQYDSHPQFFEQLKGPVLQCNEKRK